MLKVALIIMELLHLPDEVLEHVLWWVSPYADLDAVARVSARLRACARRVRANRARQAARALRAQGMAWAAVEESVDQTVTISKRYRFVSKSCWTPT